MKCAAWWRAVIPSISNRCGSVGYAQMGRVIRGAVTIDAALEEMQQETRHLAKRQLTWFRGDKEVRWFHPDADFGDSQDREASSFQASVRLEGQDEKVS